MWADVQIGPIFAKKRRKALVVWDNCGSHNGAAVHDVFAEWGITANNFPPNMTDILSMDPSRQASDGTEFRRCSTTSSPGSLNDSSTLPHLPACNRHLPRLSLSLQADCSRPSRCFASRSRPQNSRPPCVTAVSSCPRWHQTQGGRHIRAIHGGKEGLPYLHHQAACIF